MISDGAMDGSLSLDMMFRSVTMSEYDGGRWQKVPLQA
ncbi:hypothetical protein PT7_1704 [Pusillimonas sp. T7-7]|nr:hypothetical protein PT7_1704 [Pusillimonas sp. T7-7]